MGKSALVGLTLAAASLSVACPAAREPYDEDTQEVSGLGGPYPAPPLSTKGTVVATVGPAVFTTDEIQKRLAALPAFARGQLEDPERLQAWVSSLVREEIIAQKAWQEGLQNQHEVLAKIRKLLVAAYTENAIKTSGSLEPSEAELRAAYEAKNDQYNRPARVRLSQLVRGVDTPKERAEAQALLEKIRDEVIAGQKRRDYTVFSKAVRKHSEDEATRMGGGDLQFLSQAELAERYGADVAAVCFDEATIGDLFIANAPNAVVLFKKIGQRRAIERTFAQVRSQIRSQMVQEKRAQALEAWTNDLYESSGVEIDPKALGEVQIPQASPSTDDPE